MSTSDIGALPSVSELTRLANEFFAAQPGRAAPTAPVQAPQPGGVDPQASPVPVPTLEQLAAIPQTLAGLLGVVPAVPGGIGAERLGDLAVPGPDAAVPGAVSLGDVPVPGPQAAVPGAPPGQAPQPGGVDPQASPVPVPTLEQLAAIPQTLAGLLGVVPDVPGGIAPEHLGDVPMPGPDAAVPGALPLVDRPHAAAGEPGPALAVFEFSPQMVPSLQGTSASARPFDPVAIRRDFPILNERVHGKRLVWLDNGATTQKPQAVIDRISEFYEHENSNIHRAAHTLAARATDAYEGARAKVARFLNAGDPGSIVFVRGATEGINLVAKSWGAANVREGDEILVTHLEHHANIVPWQQLCQQTGARLVVAPVDDTGQIILSEFERLVGPRTRIAAITAVSNALGTITPVAQMTQIAHRKGAKVLVDAAQSVLHMRVDVQEIGCDFLVFSGHKVFAPTGIGAVYGTAEVWEDSPPWQGGGNMIADVTFERTVYMPPPNRFEAGTGSIADAVGLGAALDYLTAVGIDNVTAYEQELLRYGTDCLLTIPGLRIIGTASHKAAVLSFVLRDHPPEEVGKALDAEGIAVRAGHHCAQPILRRFGVEATVRPSLAMYNTHEDLDLLTAALRRLVNGQSPGL